MTNLPKSLDLKFLMAREMPGDVTLAQALGRNHCYQAHLAISPDRVRVRFLDEKGKEAHGEMLLSTARKLISDGQLHIVIDDGEGGELVE